MYAILIELDAAMLDLVRPALSTPEAYNDIDASLAANGFNRGQGGLYFGDANATAVTAVMAATSLAKFPAASAVTAIRLFRIEETADLIPAMDMVPPLT